MQLRTLDQANIQPAQRVFVRCDLDVTTDYFRLEAGLPTLKYIIDHAAVPIIAGHRHEEGQSTSDLRPFYEKNLSGAFEILENLRLDPREEENSPDYAKEVIEKHKIDLYVNEAFATSHREHTSFIQLPKLVPAFAGFRLQKEVETLSKIMNNPERPLVAIIGGAKIESKEPTILKFIQFADDVLVGGLIAQDWHQQVPENLHLAIDNADKKDLSDDSIQQFVSYIGSSKTVVWAGPVGVFEEQKYEAGTKAIAQAVANSNAFSVVGGGDTIDALNKFGLFNKISFVSTGGGAMLQFIENGTLPALEALKI